MVRPFASGNDPKFCLQINGNVFWEKRKLDGNLKKLCAVLQANLRLKEFLKIKMKEPERDPRKTSYVFISKENQANAFKEGPIILEPG